jgi:hypothetical protein
MEVTYFTRGKLAFCEPTCKPLRTSAVYVILIAGVSWSGTRDRP